MRNAEGGISAVEEDGNFLTLGFPLSGLGMPFERLLHPCVLFMLSQQSGLATTKKGKVLEGMQYCSWKQTLSKIKKKKREREAK